MTKFTNWAFVVDVFALAGREGDERKKLERATGVLDRGHRRIATCPVLAAWVARRGPHAAARFALTGPFAVPGFNDPTEIDPLTVRIVLDELAFRIFDWHVSRTERERAKLARMTYADAVSAANRWHNGKAVRDEREHRRLAKGPPLGEGEKLESFEERYWTRLTTRDALRQESIRLHHCVGRDRTQYAALYVEKAVDYPEGIWSLREAEGTRSLLTAEIDGDGAILHCRGYWNAEPRRELEGDVRMVEMHARHASFISRYEDRTP